MKLRTFKNFENLTRLLKLSSVIPSGLIDPILKSLIERFGDYLDEEKFKNNDQNISQLIKINNFAKGKCRFISEGGEGMAFYLGGLSQETAHFVLKIIANNIFLNRENDISETLSILYSKEDMAKNEPMIHSSGNFFIEFTDPYVKPLKIEWKIMEIFYRPKPSNNNEYYSDLKKILSIIEAYLFKIALRIVKGDDELYTKYNANAWSRYNTSYMIFLKNELTKEELNSYFEAIEKHIQETMRTSIISKDMSDDYLLELIKTIFYQGSERGKSDISVNNIGIRKSTGLFVFFDA